MDGNGIASDSDSEVLQRRSHMVHAVGPAHSLAYNNLFVLIGPTGSGKSTVQQRVEPFVSSTLRHITKEQTRQKRDQLDPGREVVSKKLFKQRRAIGTYYLFEYKVNYSDNRGEPKSDLYGIPRRSFYDALTRGDAMLTLTDPRSFRGFFEEDLQREIGYIRTIPVIITADSPDDLVQRLSGRECDEGERQRRIKQAQDQWMFFRDVAKTADHVIINNTLPDYRNLVRNQPEQSIPDVLMQDVKASIDTAIIKFANIVNFYRHLKETPMKIDGDFDVHRSYLDWVSSAFFGADYGYVVEALEEGKHLMLNQSRDLIERIKRETGNSLRVEGIFEKLVARGVTNKRGVIEIEFNDFVSTTGRDDGMKIVSSILPQYGIKLPCGKIRYSLTDRLRDDDREGVYAIDLKLC